MFSVGDRVVCVDKHGPGKYIRNLGIYVQLDQVGTVTEPIVQDPRYLDEYRCRVKFDSSEHQTYISTSLVRLLSDILKVI